MPNVNTRLNLNLLDLFIPAIFDSNTTLQTKKFLKASLTPLLTKFPPIPSSLVPPSCTSLS